MKVVLETIQLSKKYGKHIALEDLSFKLYKGDIYGLVGKNGAGKSTLFSLLMGLTEPSSGHIEIKGYSEKRKLNLLRKSMGFMMGANYFPYLTARENLEYYRKIKGIQEKSEVDRVLRLVEMEDVTKEFKSFSMGMKQRISIANALMGNPDIIILDEPTNGLDPEGIADIRKIIQKLNQELGITFIISSHILSELGVIANRFGFIHKGKLVEELTNQELQEKTRNQLIIEVDHVEKAAFLLEKKLETTNYRIINEHLIEIEDFINEPEKIADVLVHEGIKLKKLAARETTLENYFLELIGGKEND